MTFLIFFRRYWVGQWEESTDPQKFIFEDVGIASFLICLWEQEQQQYSLTKKQSFVDLGAGNGFLVYLLTMEGYSGKGIDIQKRKVHFRSFFPENLMNFPFPFLFLKIFFF